MVRGLRLGATFVQLLLERGQLLIPRAVQSGLLLPRAALLGVTAVQARQKRKQKAAAGCVARAGQGTNLVPHALPSGRRSWSESLACCFDFAVRLSEQAKVRISQHIPRQKHDALTLQSAGPRRGTRRAGRVRGSLARRAAYHRCQEEWRARGESNCSRPRIKNKGTSALIFGKTSKGRREGTTEEESLCLPGA